MRTVLRCVPLFSLFGLLAVALTASAAENGTTQVRRRSHVATVPGAFDGAVKTAGFTPKHLKTSTRFAGHTTSTRFAGHVTEQDVVEGGTYYEDPDTGQLRMSNGHFSEPMGQPMGDMMGQPMGGMMGEPMGDMGCADGSCGSCGDCAYTACCLPFSRGNLQVFGGVQGFTGPANRSDGSGSFGFYEGLNWGTPLPGFGALAGQVGFRATQSNLSGADFTDSTRRQGFLTVGLFRRVDAGLQGGLVADYMSESWYRDTDLTNVRGELSWVHSSCRDLGFWFTKSTKSSLDGALAEKWEPTDLFALFFRQQFGSCGDGEARLSVGWSNRSDGYLAVDTLLPLTGSLSMEANFAYLIPEQGKGTGFGAGHTHESWNIGFGLVWYPGRCRSGSSSYYRPLLRVADNGVFMMDRTSP